MYKLSDGKLYYDWQDYEYDMVQVKTLDFEEVEYFDNLENLSSNFLTFFPKIKSLFLTVFKIDLLIEF